ncbi:MAG: MFS transporter [Planctomycetota bacterium]
MPTELSHELNSPLVHGAMAVIALVLVVVLGRELRHVPKQLLVLMLTAFVDMAGLFMVIPLVPFYVERLGEGGVQLLGHTFEVGQLVGLVVSCYTVAQLISSPFWGRLSDRWGRRPVLLIALIASALAYLLFGFADTLLLLALSRVVQGAGGGTVGVIQSYVADAVEPAQRARALGWLSAATNLGVAFGPVIGSGAVALGKLDLMPGEGSFSIGAAAPGIAAALLCLINALFAWRFLPESRQHAPSKQRPSVIGGIGTLLSQPTQPATRLILIYAIAIGSAHGLNPLMAPFLGERFGFDETTIGYFFFYIGSLSVLARVLVLGRVVDRFGEVRVFRIGLCALAAAFLLLPFADSLGMLALIVTLQPLGMSLTFSCLTSLLSRMVPAAQRGLYMGLQQSFAGLARVGAPNAYGWSYDLHGPGVAFRIAGAVIFGTQLFGIGLRRSTDAGEAAKAGGAGSRT